MSKEKAKSMYDSLKESGDLKTFCPSLVGDWDVDKKRFMSLFNANEDILYGTGDDDDFPIDEFGFIEDF